MGNRKRHNRRVSAALLKQMRHDFAAGLTQEQVAAKYGIAKSYMYYVKKHADVNKMYEHLSGDVRKAKERKKRETRLEKVNGKSIPVGVVPRWDPFSEAKARVSQKTLEKRKAEEPELRRAEAIVVSTLPSRPQSITVTPRSAKAPRSYKRYYANQAQIAENLAYVTQALGYLVEQSSKRRTLRDRIFGR